MPEWLAQNIGTALTVGGSIVVAIIGGLFAVWAKNHVPKQPIPIQDVWTENRALRDDLRTSEKHYGELDDRHRVLRDAFDALHAYVARLIAAWGLGPLPAMTPSERRKIAAVADDTDTPAAGTPVGD